jgi:hypothetical protein
VNIRVNISKHKHCLALKQPGIRVMNGLCFLELKQINPYVFCGHPYVFVKQPPYVFIQLPDVYPYVSSYV